MNLKGFRYCVRGGMKLLDNNFTNKRSLKDVFFIEKKYNSDLTSKWINRVSQNCSVFLEKLTAEQQHAVTDLEHQVVQVSGCPGGGKTQALIGRVSTLLRKELLRSRICLVTFTVNATQEIRERVEEELDVGEPFILVETFHSLCKYILSNCKALDLLLPGVRPSSSFIATPREVELFLEDTLQDHDVKQWRKESMAGEARKEVSVKTAETLSDSRLLNKFKSYKNAIQMVKNARNVYGASYDELYRTVSDLCVTEHKVLREVAGTPADRSKFVHIMVDLEARLRKNHYIALDDLIGATAYLFLRYPHVMNSFLEDRFQHFVVDEMQDANVPQIALLETMLRSNGSLFVVGDENQVLYRWRGVLGTMLDVQSVCPSSGNRLRLLPPELSSLHLLPFTPVTPMPPVTPVTLTTGHMESSPSSSSSRSLSPLSSSAPFQKETFTAPDNLSEEGKVKQENVPSSPLGIQYMFRTNFRSHASILRVAETIININAKASGRPLTFLFEGSKKGPEVADGSIGELIDYLNLVPSLTTGNQFSSTATTATTIRSTNTATTTTATTAMTSFDPNIAGAESSSPDGFNTAPESRPSPNKTVQSIPKDGCHVSEGDSGGQASAWPPLLRLSTLTPRAYKDEEARLSQQSFPQRPSPVFTSLFSSTFSEQPSLMRVWQQSGSMDPPDPNPNGSGLKTQMTPAVEPALEDSGSSFQRGGGGSGEEELTWRQKGVTFMTESTAASEADRIAMIIEQEIRNGRKPSDIAVLFRTNKQICHIEEALLARGIPYIVPPGSVSFWGNSYTNELLSILRIAAMPHSASGSDIRAMMNAIPRPYPKDSFASFVDCMSRNFELPRPEKPRQKSSNGADSKIQRGNERGSNLRVPAGSVLFGDVPDWRFWREYNRCLDDEEMSVFLGGSPGGVKSVADPTNEDLNAAPEQEHQEHRIQGPSLYDGTSHGSVAPAATGVKRNFGMVLDPPESVAKDPNHWWNYNRVAPVKDLLSQLLLPEPPPPLEDLQGFVTLYEEDYYSPIGPYVGSLDTASLSLMCANKLGPMVSDDLLRLKPYKMLEFSMRLPSDIPLSVPPDSPGCPLRKHYDFEKFKRSGTRLGHWWRDSLTWLRDVPAAVQLLGAHDVRLPELMEVIDRITCVGPALNSKYHDDEQLENFRRVLSLMKSTANDFATERTLLRDLIRKRLFHSPEFPTTNVIEFSGSAEGNDDEDLGAAAADEAQWELARDERVDGAVDLEEFVRRATALADRAKDIRLREEELGNHLGPPVTVSSADCLPNYLEPLKSGTPAAGGGGGKNGGRGAVTLSTMHGSKGLEFPVVFVAGIEEGIAAGMGGRWDPEVMLDEQKLLYVAVTRAKERLYLLWTIHRHWARAAMVYNDPLSSPEEQKEASQALRAHNEPSVLIRNVMEELHKSGRITQADPKSRRDRCNENVGSCPSDEN